mgnify:CR=1 FL=1
MSLWQQFSVCTRTSRRVDAIIYCAVRIRNSFKKQVAKNNLLRHLVRALQPFLQNQNLCKSDLHYCTFYATNFISNSYFNILHRCKLLSYTTNNLPCCENHSFGQWLHILNIIDYTYVQKTLTCHFIAFAVRYMH